MVNWLLRFAVTMEPRSWTNSQADMMNYTPKETYFLPVSHSLERRLVQDGCDPKKVRVLRSGIDLTKFTYAERKLGVGEIPRVLTIARLVERKGLDYALKSVARIEKERQAGFIFYCRRW
jgi:glycosyltransferase involved in cell wall biosynthesis